MKKYRMKFEIDWCLWDIIPFIQLDVGGIPASLLIGWLCFSLVIPFGETERGWASFKNENTSNNNPK